MMIQINTLAEIDLSRQLQRTVSSLACKVGSHSMTFAPYPRTADFLTSGELLGITTYAGIPRILAANAKA